MVTRPLLDADEIVKTYRAQQARREDQLVEALDAGRNDSELDDVSHLAQRRPGPVHRSQSFGNQLFGQYA